MFYYKNDSVAVSKSLSLIVYRFTNLRTIGLGTNFLKLVKTIIKGLWKYAFFFIC